MYKTLDPFITGKMHSTYTQTHILSRARSKECSLVVFIYLERLGRINQGIHDVGSEYRSNTVLLFQCCYNLFTVQQALKLKRHERKRETGSEARVDMTSFLSSSCNCVPLTS